MTARQEIVEDVARRLALIAPGYVFDLPSGPHACTSTIRQVKPWRENPYQVGELPGIAWRDGITRIRYEEFGVRPVYHLKMAMGAYIAGSDVASRARSVLADILAAVGSDPRCGGLARWTRPDRGIVSIAAAGDVVAGARLEITIAYHPKPGTEDKPGGLVDERDRLIVDEQGNIWTW